MKKILSVLLAAIMILSAANIAVFAVDTDETKTTSATQVFADGSYIVVKLHESDETNATKATKTKTGSKDYEYHTSDGDLRLYGEAHAEGRRRFPPGGERDSG